MIDTFRPEYTYYSIPHTNALGITMLQCIHFREYINIVTRGVFEDDRACDILSPRISVFIFVSVFVNKSCGNQLCTRSAALQISNILETGNIRFGFPQTAIIASNL